MRKALPLLFLIPAALAPALTVSSCSDPEPLTPTCQCEATLYGEVLHLQIRSESEWVDIVWGSTRHRVVAHYFGCVSLKLSGNEAIFIDDNGSICEVEY